MPAQILHIAVMYLYHRSAQHKMPWKAFSLCAILPLMAGVAINGLTQERWTLSTNSAYNFYRGNNPHYTEDLDLFNPVASTVQIAERKGYAKAPNISGDLMIKSSLSYIVQHPGVFLQRALGRAARVIAPKTSQLQMAGGEKTTSVTSFLGITLLGLGAVQYGTILFAGTAGIVSFGRRFKANDAYNLAAIIGVSLLCLVAISKLRYSFPADGILLIFAVGFLASWRTRTLTTVQKRWVALLFSLYLWAWVAWLVFAATSREIFSG